MTIPALENGPWTFDVQNVCGEGESEEVIAKEILLQIKNSMVALSWSVVASCDSVSVKNIGDADPDLWVDVSDVVFSSSGDRSWIILENSITGEQFCINYTGSNYTYCYFRIAPDGTFNADGTTSGRPTTSGGTYLIVNGSVKTFISYPCDVAFVHIMMSADKKCTRIVIHYEAGSNSGSRVLLLDEVINTPAPWIGALKRCYTQWVREAPAMSAVNTGKGPLIQDWEHENMWLCYLQDATPYSGYNYAYPTSEGYNGLVSNASMPSKYSTYVTEFLDGYLCSQIGLFRDHADHGGGLGRLQDIYWAQDSHDTMDTYDSGGSRQWVKFGCLMLPWDGSAFDPVTSEFNVDENAQLGNIPSSSPVDKIREIPAMNREIP